MANDLDKLNFEDDLREVQALPGASRWTIETPGGLEVYVTLSSALKPDEKFQARLHWSQYPGQPPSIKFRDPADGSLGNPRAWPQARGMRPTALDLCSNYCTEGFALHPEWRNDPRYRWDDKGNVLLKVIQTLQDEMDDHFTGRYVG